MTPSAIQTGSQPPMRALLPPEYPPAEISRSATKPGNDRCSAAGRAGASESTSCSAATKSPAATAAETKACRNTPPARIRTGTQWVSPASFRWWSSRVATIAPRKPTQSVRCRR